MSGDQPQPKKCPYCKHKIRLNRWERHTTSLCPQRPQPKRPQPVPVTCDLCKKKIPAARFALHLNSQCPARKRGTIERNSFRHGDSAQVPAWARVSMDPLKPKRPHIRPAKGASHSPERSEFIKALDRNKQTKDEGLSPGWWTGGE